MGPEEQNKYFAKIIEKNDKHGKYKIKDKKKIEGKGNKSKHNSKDKQDKGHKGKDHKDKDNKDKDHKNKDHKDKEKKGKDHKEKDHKGKDHKDKDHKGKGKNHKGKKGKRLLSEFSKDTQDKTVMF